MIENQSLLGEIPAPLLAWYGRSARVLPWRSDPQPYAVWVSEIMLQQTRVEAALPYFQRFLQALPTVKDLAEAPEEQLLKLWEGLGYYNRARNLQKAAQIIVERHGGNVPASAKELCSLPGIGRYTAGAIASIAFGQREPAVDGNVLRVLSRVLLSGADILKEKTKAEFARAISAVLPQDRPGDFNQALMELGATVCLPNGAPRCGACPLAAVCLANKTGRQAEFPQKAEKKARRVEARTVFVLFDRAGRVAVQKRPKTGLLAGLWELPGEDGALSLREAENALRAQGLQVQAIQSAGKAKHVFTHVEWKMEGVAALVEGTLGTARFVTPKELEEEYCLPSAFAAYVQKLPALWAAISAGPEA